MKKDDIVIVPLGKNIAIAKVLGEKLFESSFTDGHGANQIRVEFFRKENKIIRIPRSTLDFRHKSKNAQFI